MSTFVCPKAPRNNPRHNFPTGGAVCAYGCGVAQSDLMVGPPKSEHSREPAGDRSKGMHSDIQYWAREIAEYTKEPKRFGMYLGIVKYIGVPAASRILSEMRSNPDIKTPAKLFMWKIKQLSKASDKKT